MDDAQLYKFNYTKKKTINLNMLNNKKVDILMNKLIFELHENDIISQFIINNFKFNIENKIINSSIENILLTTNITSSLFNLNKLRKKEEVENDNKDSNEITTSNDITRDNNDLKENIFIQSEINTIIANYNNMAFSLNKINVQKEKKDISIDFNKIEFNFPKKETTEQKQESSRPKNSIDISTIKIELNKELNFSISKILINNIKENINKKFNIEINELKAKNKDKIIFAQDIITIDISITLATQHSISLDLSDIIINLSKNDIQTILNYIPKKKNMHKNEQKKEGGGAKKRTKNFNITIKTKLPFLAVSLSSENDKKICGLILENLETVGNINIVKDSVDIEKSIKILLGKINLIYYDKNDFEYKIIEYKEHNEGKSAINFNNKNIAINNIIEINYNDNKDTKYNEIYTNINNLNINIKADILMNLILGLKDILPKKKSENENGTKNQKSEIKKRKKEIKLNINLNEFNIIVQNIYSKGGVIKINIKKINNIFTSVENRKLSMGQVEFNLDELSMRLIDNDEINQIIKTEKDFIKAKVDLKEESFDIDVIIDKILANLTFTDISLIKEIISSNVKYIKSNKKNLKNKKTSNITPTPTPQGDAKSIIFNFIMKNIQFNLIDNYANNYLPFIT